MEKSNIGVATQSALSVAHCAKKKKKKTRSTKPLFLNTRCPTNSQVGDLPAYQSRLMSFFDITILK